VPVEAAVVEAGGRAAVRVVLAVDGRRLDEVAADPEEPHLVDVEDPERERPAARSLPEHSPRDVAGGAAAEDGRGHVGDAVAGEVVADERVDSAAHAQRRPDRAERRRTQHRRLRRRSRHGAADAPPLARPAPMAAAMTARTAPSRSMWTRYGEVKTLVVLLAAALL